MDYEKAWNDMRFTINESILNLENLAKTYTEQGKSHEAKLIYRKTKEYRNFRDSMKRCEDKYCK